MRETLHFILQKAERPWSSNGSQGERQSDLKMWPKSRIISSYVLREIFIVNGKSGVRKEILIHALTWVDSDHLTPSGTN